MEFEKREANDFFKVRSLDKYLDPSYKGFIAGGCFKNLFNNEKLKDIDIFYRDLQDYSSSVKYYKDSKLFTDYYSNDKVEAFKHEDGTVVECINTVFGTPEEIISNFDFTIVQFAYNISIIKGLGPEDDIIERRVIYHKDFFTHLHLKRLVIDGLTRELPFILSTFDRLFRYAKYGYYPCRGTKLRVIQEINMIENLDLNGLNGGLYNGFD